MKTKNLKFDAKYIVVQDGELFFMETKQEAARALKDLGGNRLACETQIMRVRFDMLGPEELAYMYGFFDAGAKDDTGEE